MADDGLKLSDHDRAVLERLRAAAATGDQISFAKEEAIRADLLRAAILGRALLRDEVVAPLYERGFAISGGTVQGILDLANTDVPVPLQFVGTTFRGLIDISDARTRSLRFNDAALMMLRGRLVDIDGDLVFTKTTLSGTIGLSYARIRGDFVAANSTLNPGGLALLADNVKIGGHFAVPGTMSGAIDLFAADISGNIGADGVTLSASSHKDGLTFDGEQLHVGGSLFLRRATVDGPIHLAGANIEGQLALTHSTISGREHTPTIWGQNVRVGLELHLMAATVTGGVDVSGAVIGRQLSFWRGTFKGQRWTVGEGETAESHHIDAISAEAVSVGEDVYLSHVTVEGQVDLLSMKVSGQLHADSASFDAAGHPWALRAEGIEVAQGLSLSRSTFKGTADIAGARIGGALYCQDAAFDGAGFPAFNGQRIVVAMSVFLDDAEAKGGVRLNGARIDGQLSLVNFFAEAGEDGLAIFLQDAAVRGGLFMQGLACAGRLNLDSASVGTLIDDPLGFAKLHKGCLQINGFTYKDIQFGTHWRTRLKWLECQVPESLGATFRPQPWEQVTRTLTEMGHGRDARVLSQKREAKMRRKILARATPWPWKPVGWIYKAGALLLNVFRGITVGHGYQPWFAVVWLIGFLSLGAAVFGTAYERGLMQAADGEAIVREAYSESIAVADLPPSYPKFHAGAYALDVLVPFLDLNQERFWMPREGADIGGAPPALAPATVGPFVVDSLQIDAWLRAFHWAYIALGWVFATVAVAGFSGVMKTAPRDS